MFVENSYLIWFDYTDFPILVNHIFYYQPPVLANSIEHILIRIASPLDHDGVKTDLTLANMKIDIFPLMSTIVLPKMLNLCHPVHLETLVVIYWNSYVVIEDNQCK